jgi:hypothetical protein
MRIKHEAGYHQLVLESLVLKQRMECNLSSVISLTLGKVPQVPTIY